MSSLLIHIGYHKTGSTWLQEHLFGRRDLGFSREIPARRLIRRIVSPNDFEFDPASALAAYEEKIEDALSEGRVPVMSAERFSGNLNLRLHDTMQVADRLAAVFPGARVLIVIREQRAMIFSTYRQYVYNGGMLPLEAFLVGALFWWQQPFELAQYSYDRVVAHYHERFGSENVLVLPYELFRTDGFQFVSRIVDFAGAQVDAEALEALPFAEVVNPGKVAVTVAAKRRLNRFGRHRLTPWEVGHLILALSTRIGELAPEAVNRRLEEGMRTAIAATVGDCYRESNARTAALTGMDLAAYGYDLPRAPTESVGAA